MYLTAEILGHSSAETTRKFYANPDEERTAKSMKTFDYRESTGDGDEKLKRLASKFGVSVEELRRELL
jgi:hypothetical protein